MKIRKPRKPIPRRSPGGKVLDRLDRLQFKFLKLKRGARDEIDGRTDNLKTFHIFDKSTYPRLRYMEFNVLLMSYMPRHYNWHHYGENHPRNRRTKEAIIKLRGEDYENQLNMLNAMAPRMTASVLSMIEVSFKQEIKRLEKGG